MNDKISSFEALTESSILNQKLSLGDSGMRFILHTFDRVKNVPVKYDKNTMKFIRIRAYTTEWDFTVIPVVFKKEYIPMRTCRRDDYAESDNMKSYFQYYSDMGH